MQLTYLPYVLSILHIGGRIFENSVKVARPLLLKSPLLHSDSAYMYSTTALSIEHISTNTVM